MVVFILGWTECSWMYGYELNVACVCFKTIVLLNGK